MCDAQLQAQVKFDDIDFESWTAELREIEERCAKLCIEYYHYPFAAKSRKASDNGDDDSGNRKRHWIEPTTSGMYSDYHAVDHNWSKINIGFLKGKEGDGGPIGQPLDELAQLEPFKKRRLAYILESDVNPIASARKQLEQLSKSGRTFTSAGVITDSNMVYDDDHDDPLVWLAPSTTAESMNIQDNSNGETVGDLCEVTQQLNTLGVYEFKSGHDQDWFC